MERKFGVPVDIGFGHFHYESLSPKDFDNGRIMEIEKAYFANRHTHYCSTSSSPSSTSPSDDSSRSSSASSEIIEMVMRIAIPSDDESSVDEDIALLMQKLQIRDKQESSVLPLLKPVPVRPTSLALHGQPRIKYGFKLHLPSPLPIGPTSAFNFFVYPAYFPKNLNNNVGCFVVESRNRGLMFNPEKYCVQFLEPGLYRISVCLNQNGYQNIDGSPFVMMLHDFKAKFEFSRRIHPRPVRKLHPFGTLKFWGLAVSFANDLIYVSQNNDILVLAVCPDGFFPQSFIGSVPWRDFPGGFHPTGLACDDVNHRLLVTDKVNHCIIVFSYFGHFLQRFGTQGKEIGQFSYPWGIAASPNGEFIAVADSRNHRIQIFNKNFEFIRIHQFSVYEDDPNYKQSLEVPRGIAFNFASTRFYVSDITGNKIMEYDIGLTFERIISSNVFAGPQGIRMDFYGNIVVCDTRRDTIAVMDERGIINGAIQRSTIREVGEIVKPFDVAICGSGIVVFIDKFGSRLAMV